MKSSLLQQVFLLAGLTLASPAAAESKADTALFGLFEVTESSSPVVDRSLAGRLGCNILRTGRIMAQDGNIGLPQPGMFVMLSCPDGILGRQGASLDGLVPGAKRIALFEGRLSMAGSGAGPSSPAGRQYIVKISTFNNGDPVARGRELDRINGLVADRPDPFTPEAVLDVSNALGAPRPDEVTVIYYDSGEAGERFRANNPDVLQMIGQFNSSHVDRFIYYVGMSQD